PVTHLGGTSTPPHPAFHVEGRRGGYLVTARHLPGAARALHRAYLVLEGSLGALLARDRARGPRTPASPGWRWRAPGTTARPEPLWTTARSGATFTAMP